VSGFTSGDGSFHIVLRNSNTKSGVLARFSIHLHIRELEVLKGIGSYLILNNNSDIQSNNQKKINISCKVLWENT
jgi:hypothetical protein